MVVVLVVGFVGSALAAPTVGRLTGAERQQRLAHTLAILGALVAAFGVILFFAAEWREIARPLRVLILVAGLVALYGAGFVAARRYGRRHVGHAFLFLATVLSGASVFLIGRMYDFDGHDPLGFLLWAVVALAVAFVVRSGPIAALGFGSLFAWLVHETADVVEGQFLFDEFTVLPAYMTLYGIALYALGTGAARWLEPRRFTRPMRYLGYAFLSLGLVPMSFADAYGFAQFDRALEVNRIAVIVGALAAAAGVGVVALALLRWRDRRVALAEAAVLAGIGALSLTALLAPERGDHDVTTYPLLFNLAIAVLAFGAVGVGLLVDEVWLANAGAVLVGADVLLRFFDDEWSVLELAALYTVVGGSVFALAVALERRTRDIVIRPQ